MQFPRTYRFQAVGLKFELKSESGALPVYEYMYKYFLISSLDSVRFFNNSYVSFF